MPASIDARLLKKYFDKNTIPYTDEQKRRITGFGLLATMTNLDRVRAGRISATESCPGIFPQAQRYDPIKNPKGGALRPLRP